MDDQPRLADPTIFTADAQAFAESLSRTVQSVAGPHCQRFLAQVSTDKSLEAYVRQDDRAGVLLTQGREPLLRLAVRFRLVADHKQEHLKVISSIIHVFPEGGTLPLFRYEFEDDLEDLPQPAAHVQFHGEHPELASTMTSAGRTKTRSTGRGQPGPNITDLHFPVGGSRFRPCLEDVLEMLIYEFRIDPEPDREQALNALAIGRMGWRDMQLRTAIRDKPSTAVDQLRRMGYSVAWEGTNPEPEPRTEALRHL